jgi:hypothetical protein
MLHSSIEVRPERFENSEAPAASRTSNLAAARGTQYTVALRAVTARWRDELFRAEDYQRPVAGDQRWRGKVHSG